MSDSIRVNSELLKLLKEHADARQTTPRLLLEFILAQAFGVPVPEPIPAGRPKS